MEYFNIKCCRKTEYFLRICCRQAVEFINALSEIRKTYESNV
nr:MAG TPA: hypothetical protein [Caudoviricetes sp.]DAK04597.1 MAG TPA: hypothetical protein [Caudoviricetes sp.]